MSNIAPSRCTNSSHHLWWWSLTLSGHEGSVWSVAYSPDGRQLASAGDDGNVRLWDLEDPTTERLTLVGHNKRVNLLAYSPDGRQLASASNDGNIRLWDLEDPMVEPIVLIDPEGPVRSVAYSADGRQLVSAGFLGNIHLWNLEDPTAEPSALIGYEGSILSVTISPDGKQLASTSGEGTIRLWSLEDPVAALLVLSSNVNLIWSLVYSPDGNQLAVSGEDKTIYLWDLSYNTAEPIHLSGHAELIWSVAYSPDGKQLASANDDGSVHLWPMTSHLLSLSCQHIRRNLTWQEWRRYLPLEDFYRLTCPHLPAPPDLSKAIILLSEVERQHQLEILRQQSPAAAEKIQLQFPQAFLEAAVEQILIGDISLATGLLAELTQYDSRFDTTTGTITVWREATSLMNQGNASKGKSLFENVLPLLGAPSLATLNKYSPNDLNQICWWGSLWGYASDVLLACESAADRAPENGNIADSRGAARALNGDFTGAIEDFRFYIEWAEELEQTEGNLGWEEIMERRRFFIEELEAGRNPFTDEAILEQLRNE